MIWFKTSFLLWGMFETSWEKEGQGMLGKASSLDTFLTTFIAPATN